VGSCKFPLVDRHYCDYNKKKHTLANNSKSESDGAATGTGFADTTMDTKVAEADAMLEMTWY
jgi:hypothetical protein